MVSGRYTDWRESRMLAGENPSDRSEVSEQLALGEQ